MKAAAFMFAMAVWMLLPARAVAAEAEIADASAADVAHCTFIKEVAGRSVFGARLSGPGTEKAKQDARSQAAKAGATHIVWDKPDNSDVTTIAGKAYRCGR
jgi:hypothetical protein